MNAIKRSFCFLFFLVIFIPGTMAQVPTVQDCLGAIPLCQEIIVQNNSYTGAGNYPLEIVPPFCCISNEVNAVWYTFTIQQTGIIDFAITPINPNDDYDWAIFDLTNNTCAELTTTPMQVSCNFGGNNGGSGITGTYGGTAQQTSPSFSVTAGSTFAMIIANWSSSQSGYVLDFTASTAQLFDTISPFMDSTSTVLNFGDTTFNVIFSENIYCNSVQASDFSFTGPGGPYSMTSVIGTTCSIGADYGREYVFTFSPPIANAGLFTLSIIDTVYDLCSRPPVIPDSLLLKTCPTPSTLNPFACKNYITPGGDTLNSSGVYLDTIPNTGGCDSIITINLTINNSTSSLQTIAACHNFISPSGNYTWTSSGSYADTITNAGGCDSIMAFNLTINIVDTSITQTGATLTATATGASYQWLDCNNGFSSVSAATTQTFTATVNGSYAVAITQGGCSDTSGCTIVTGVGISEIKSGHHFEIFPNPANTDFTIVLEESSMICEMIITDITGKVIYTIASSGTKHITVNAKIFTEGVYLLQIHNSDFIETKKLIITKN